MASETKDIGIFAGGIGWLLIVIVGIACLSMWGCPQYSVYKQGKDGEARLRESESSRRIAIEEAKAKDEAATLLADAEIKRAKGVAEANKIIGESLKNNEAYLRYLWITGLESGNGRETVYVPTEAGLPVLEAGRFGKQGRQADEEERKKAEKK